MTRPEPLPTTWRRVSAGELVREGWHRDRRLAFGLTAETSSRPGTPPRAGTRTAAPELAGPPAVFPYHADTTLAWRSHPDDPRPKSTVRFDAPVPAVGVRIFETWKPGAVVSVEAGTADGRVLRLHAADAARTGGPEAVAAVLEIALPAPEMVTDVRLTLDPAGGGPVAIDAVALVLAAEAAPPGTDWMRPRHQRSLRWTIGAHLAGLALVGGLLAAALPGGDPLLPNAQTIPAAATVVPLSTLLTTPRALRWADAADEAASTPAAVPGYAPRYAAGAPDAAQPPSDAPERTWSPPEDAPYHRELAGLTLEFSPPCEARGIVIVETVGSGALRAVDVGATPMDPIRVFEAGEGAGPEQLGAPRTPPAGAVRAGPGEAVVLMFRAPLNVGRARLLFDPRSIPGTVAVDAVGLIPAAQGGCATQVEPIRPMRTNDSPRGSGGPPGAP